MFACVSPLPVIKQLLALNACDPLPEVVDMDLGMESASIDMRLCTLQQDTAFVQQLRQCNDALLQRQISACSAICKWAVNGAMEPYNSRLQTKLNVAQLRANMFAQWGISARTVAHS